MGTVDGDYAIRYSHATVSRWESGATRPTLQRIMAFGKALDLSTAEVAGLLLLAGLVPDFQRAMRQASLEPGVVAADEIGESGGRGRSPGTAVVAVDEKVWTIEKQSSRAIGAVRFLILRCLPLGLCMAGGGYALSLFMWNEDWIPIVYVSLVAAIVLAQGFLLPSQNCGPREFFWVSIFVLLTTPFLQFAPVGLDHYNFCLILGSPGGLIGYMLALLVNLALAGGAGLMFHLSWGWQYSSRRGSQTALGRAVWVALPPVCVVYGVVVVISNISVSVQLTFALPVVAALFVLLLFLRDPSVTLKEQDQRFLLSTLVALAVVWSGLGLLTIVGIYLSPDLPMVLPDHNLLRSWEIDFSGLGYSKEEALDRLNLGYSWHAMCMFSYMFFVVAGGVFAAVYRAGTGGRGGDRVGESEVSVSGGGG